MVYILKFKFDQDFYLIINLAVGGTNGYFQNIPMGTSAFWADKTNWEPSWDLTGEDSALQIRELKVERLD